MNVVLCDEDGHRWMAPESYTDGTWDLRTDVWMVGVLLWGLKTGGVIEVVIVIVFFVILVH